MSSRSTPARIALGVTGGAWAAAVLLEILVYTVPEPNGCGGGNSFAPSPVANTAMAILLLAMVAGAALALPAALTALVLGRSRQDRPLARTGRNTLIAAVVLLPFGLLVLVETLLRGACFSF